MEGVQAEGRAKLNLTLEVTGREGDFHTLDSLVAILDLSDTVTVRPREEGINVSMRGIPCDVPLEKNNAFRAANAFFSAFGEQCKGNLGADIDIEKRIPVGGGLGGSSADAAGVLLALAKLHGVERDALVPLAESLGSDTAAQLQTGYLRMRGRGEKLSPVLELPPLYFVLLCPATGVPTADCYRFFDALELALTFGATERAISALHRGEEPPSFANDLLLPACLLNGDVMEALEAAHDLSPDAVGMTGSGSAVFALFYERAARDEAMTATKFGKFAAIAAQTHF